jgi:hypothetical protein
MIGMHWAFAVDGLLRCQTFFIAGRHLNIAFPDTSR